MNRKIVCMAVCAVMAMSAAALTGCGDSDSSSEKSAASSSKSQASTSPISKDTDVAAIAEKLASDIEYKDQLMEFTDDKIESVVGISKDKFKVGKVYRGSGATAEEIGCFEAVDNDAAKEIDDMYKNYLTSQIERYRDYAPDELDKLTDAVLVRQDNFVFFSVSDDSSKAKEIIYG